MKRRLFLLPTLIAMALAFAVYADKKLNAPTLVLSRVEGAKIDMLFNPAEVAIEKTAVWSSKGQKANEDAPELEFTGESPRSMSVELMFDTFETTKDNVYERYVKALDSLMLPDPQLKRPPMVHVGWGTNTNGLPAFEGVVESVGTKYTMFLDNGTPVRATCSVKIKEASRLSTKGDQPPCP